MACMLGFSSTLSTTAFNGGFRYNPTTSAALGANSLSVLTHQLRCLCRWMPSRRRIRQTAYTLDSSLSATAGPSQCDMPGGGGCSSRASTRFRNAASYLAGLPDRRPSRNPPQPPKRESLAPLGDSGDGDP